MGGSGSLVSESLFIIQCLIFMRWIDRTVLDAKRHRKAREGSLMYFTAHQRSKEPPGRGDITQITMWSMSRD